MTEVGCLLRIRYYTCLIVNSSFLVSFFTVLVVIFNLVFDYIHLLFLTIYSL